MHQRLGLAEHADEIGREQALDHDRAHVEQREVVAARRDHHAPVEEAVAAVGAQFDRFVCEQGGEDRRAVGQKSEQRVEAGRADAGDLIEREQRLEALGALVQNRRVAAKQQRARIGARAQCGEETGVLAAVGDAIERIGDEAERLRPARRFEKSLIHVFNAPCQPVGRPAGQDSP